MKLFPSLVLLTLTVIAIQVMPLTNGANILVTVLIQKASSHAKSMSAISGALTRRGHNVTILTCSAVGTKGFKRDTYNSALQYKFEHSPEFHATEEMIMEMSFEKSHLNKVIGLGKIFYLLRQACENLFEDSATLALLKESHFDILIGDVFDGCDAILSSYLGIPYIALTTSMRYPFFHEHLYGIPSPSSYVPLGTFPLSDRMTFPERVASFIEHNFVLSFSHWVHFGALEKIKDKYGIAPDRSIADLIGGAELWLCMTTFAFDFSHPIAPNWVAIGNIADIPAKPLNKEYEAFVEGSGEHGFIILALGNNYGELPKHMAEAFARVFSDLPQRVIWRNTGTRPRYLGNNTMLVDWMPQNDLLGHPKARLLIYHGGLTGIFEAIYHAVPMVVMPIFGDQDSNAVKVEAKGMGRILQKDPISYETVMEAVIDVLENPRYRENVRRSSRIYRDTQAHPDETMVYWVEHILKFGGSHLRSRALELSFIQLHSIDVLALIVGIIAGIVFILYTCSKRCLSCCLKSRKSKVE
ncbi:UDP-glucuronosyltransferase 1-2-like [Strongylocentrotus purpuratus]|uniref:UDP-glucuronosyltransferase n=1 Tax=Strongylocentrotus purpuratus TaxID=7668 RepID=A0A7M7N4B9_STRPU|nr:UDP-glucuronosyltransferase 1-2-like [Strongylocentrotus purpuratus]